MTGPDLQRRPRGSRGTNRGRGPDALPVDEAVMQLAETLEKFPPATLEYGAADLNNGGVTPELRAVRRALADLARAVARRSDDVLGPLEAVEAAFRALPADMRQMWTEALFSPDTPTSPLLHDYTIATARLLAAVEAEEATQ